MDKYIFYENELEDEFAGDSIKAKIIDEKYDYQGGLSRKIGRILWYHIIAKPIAWCYMKISYGHKVVNKKVLKELNGKAYFLYGNHTNNIADPLVPTVINYFRSVYVVVHANNVSMKILGKITPSLGALPLPDNMKAMKNFSKAMENIIAKKNIVTIYPEAHIWPYYTKIRPFKKDSFGYPVMYNVPVVCFTNTYQKRKFRKKPRMVTYIDGPFYPDQNIPKPQRKQQLRDMAYNAMVERSKNNNVKLIEYIKKESEKS